MPTEYEDDGLIIESAGHWARQKHSLIGQYAAMFSSSMKDKWDCRVFIDLFASCGFIKVRRTSRIEASSAFIALNLNVLFDQYIFCDIDNKKIETLKKRVQKFYPDVKTSFLVGNANLLTDEIISEIPTPTKSNKVLCFCVIDPYKIGNFSFSTIEKLSKIFMDFLVLIPSYMDANRNIDNYFSAKDQRIENFIGDPHWREEWEKERKKKIRFGDYIVMKFNRKMGALGFLTLEQDEFVLIRNPRNRSPLYHLAFYSRNELGKKFWNAARKSSSKQQELF